MHRLFRGTGSPSERPACPDAATWLASPQRTAARREWILVATVREFSQKQFTVQKWFTILCAVGWSVARGMPGPT